MKVIPLTIGAWNVCTLMDSSSSDRSERISALVGRELDRYKVEIAALSETCLAEERLLKEVGAGYTFFWSGSKKEERREAGVGFAIKSHLVSKLSGLPKGINDRLMTLRLPLSGKRHATIVSACAPTMTNPVEVKDKFYDDLDSVISAAPRTDKLILLGDLNARVGTDHQTWEGVIGSEGVGKCNSNGLLLLRNIWQWRKYLTLLVNSIFQLGKLTDVLKIGALTPIFKKKGSSSEAKNYRGITILPIVTKLVEVILRNRIQPLIEENQNNLQRGFTRHSSPMNCSLILKEVIREYRDLRKPLYLAFLGVKSAFDVVFHESLLRKLFHIGIEGNTWTLIQSLHQDAESVVKWNGAYSDTFKLQRGVRQEGILSTDLFKLYGNDLLDRLKIPDIGSYIGKIPCIAPTSADDMVIASDRLDTLLILLNIAVDYSCQEHTYCNQWRVYYSRFPTLKGTRSWRSGHHHERTADASRARDNAYGYFEIRQ